VASNSIEQPRRLPIQVPLRPGESPLSFVRRLATANHLRTSYLRGYLARVPGRHTATIDISRLSLVTGRTTSALRHIFPDLKPTPASSSLGAPPGHHGRRHIDQADDIRVAAADDDAVNALSVHFGVPRPTVIKALLGERPDQADEPFRTNRKLRDVADLIDSLLIATSDITAKEIWTELTTQHGVAASYGTVRSYVNRARARADDPRAAQHLLNRVALYDLIRKHARGHDLVGTLTTRFSVDRNSVLWALTSKAPFPDKAPSAPTAPGRRRTRILSAHETYIDEMLAANPDLKIYEVRDHLLDQHQVDVSYGTVRDYVARRQRERTASWGRLTATLRNKRGSGAD
jgi:hypothetical protein